MRPPDYERNGIQLYLGDCLDVLRTLPSETVQCCVTSPPYWGLRDYGVEGQIGLEKTIAEYVQKMVDVFSEVKRVLRNDGTLWLNLGDSYSNVGKWGGETGGKHVFALHEDTGVGREKRDYSGLKPKDLCGIPWRVAFALQEIGWWLRQDIIWAKPNSMPESVTDRCTKSHEYIFLLSKLERYYYDAESTREKSSGRVLFGNMRKKGFCEQRRDNALRDMTPTEYRNKRSVWNISTKPFSEAHFATFPPEIPEICIKAGSRVGDVILDPFNGAGTTGMVAAQLGRKYIGIELNPEYCAMAWKRMNKPLYDQALFVEAEKVEQLSLI